MQQYTQVIRLSPGEYGPYKCRAVAYLFQKKYAEAVEDYSVAVDIQGPDSTWIRHARATPLWALGRIADAARDYRWVRTHHDDVSHADARLFLVLQDQARQFDHDESYSDAEEARQEAASVLESARRRVTPGGRLSDILECLAGTIQPSVLVASANPVNPADVCERHYYAGEASLLHGEIADACTYFHGSLATDLALQPGTISGDPMNEWHLARWRLDQLDDPAKSIACPGGS